MKLRKQPYAPKWEREEKNMYCDIFSLEAIAACVKSVYSDLEKLDFTQFSLYVTCNHVRHLLKVRMKVVLST
jgi:hypothetical protein